MADHQKVSFRRFDATGARQLRDTVELIYRDAYADAIASGDPFDSVEQFMHRFDAYTAPERGFELVVAYTTDGEPVGQSWGWPLGERSAWWNGLDEEPEPGFTQEDGHRTFALSEIMVRRSWTGQGVAHALHDELLAGRTEQRATLLVEQDNHNAYRAYRSWGWKKVGRLHPGWADAPWFDVLMLPLPVAPHDVA
ncbi:GNAT family N-acetyltransferase [Actinomadura rudentiformis]|uniref:GNAT family N-acetyltransferase n=1 Tax=Actinomadura rudentiformis TaxID=359158 RepID=A0A6H9Z0G8_9ACTN|nr:GNAT family N-acetyltransferase [Actinomadura rudentiformis]KAB2350205.1 GNAT family N-acetyltransferase [Actinomadura rudentiformis]